MVPSISVIILRLRFTICKFGFFSLLLNYDSFSSILRFKILSLKPLFFFWTRFRFDARVLRILLIITNIFDRWHVFSLYYFILIKLINLIRKCLKCTLVHSFIRIANFLKPTRFHSNLLIWALWKWRARRIRTIINLEYRWI